VCVEVEEVEREQAMDAICPGPSRLDSSGTSTVTDISTVLKVSQDSARTRIRENIHVEGLQQTDRCGEARQMVVSINEKRRRAAAMRRPRQKVD
jgi:hypothetical protein